MLQNYNDLPLLTFLPLYKTNDADQSPSILKFVVYMTQYFSWNRNASDDGKVHRPIC
jgi:hypothetical protein